EHIGEHRRVGHRRPGHVASQRDIDQPGQHHGDRHEQRQPDQCASRSHRGSSPPPGAGGGAGTGGRGLFGFGATGASGDRFTGGGGIGTRSGLDVPGTGGAGNIPGGSGGFGSARFGLGFTNGGPTATRFPFSPTMVPGGGARSFGG